MMPLRREPSCIAMRAALRVCSYRFSARARIVRFGQFETLATPRHPRIDCTAPCAMYGSIGCAASPISVTRPTSIAERVAIVKRQRWSHQPS